MRPARASLDQIAGFLDSDSDIDKAKQILEADSQAIGSGGSSKGSKK
ncbi:hypothetical protein SynA1544_03183 [Synechococcus sp. A15-44]|nr:hypothetical protein SynA1544_03183 [Synechococcus sp. A15-44]